MLTGANAITGRSQEVLASSGGGLHTLGSPASVQLLTATGTIAGALTLVGVVIIGGSNDALVTFTSGAAPVGAWKAGAYLAASMPLNAPVLCPDGITATLSGGTGCSIYVYFRPI